LGCKSPIFTIETIILEISFHNGQEQAKERYIDSYDSGYKNLHPFLARPDMKWSNRLYYWHLLEASSIIDYQHFFQMQAIRRHYFTSTLPKEYLCPRLDKSGCLSGLAMQ